MPPTQIQLSPRTQKRLQQLAKARCRPLQRLMYLAIRQYLDCEESYEREKRQDRERWQRFEHSGHSISQETAAAWLEQLAEGEEEEAACPV